MDQQILKLAGMFGAGTEQPAASPLDQGDMRTNTDTMRSWFEQNPDHPQASEVLDHLNWLYNAQRENALMERDMRERETGDPEFRTPKGHPLQPIHGGGRGGLPSPPSPPPQTFNPMPGEGGPSILQIPRTPEEHAGSIGPRLAGMFGGAPESEEIGGSAPAGYDALGDPALDSAQAISEFILANPTHPQTKALLERMDTHMVTEAQQRAARQVGIEGEPSGLGFHDYLEENPDLGRQFDDQRKLEMMRMFGGS